MPDEPLSTDRLELLQDTVGCRSSADLRQVAQEARDQLFAELKRNWQRNNATPDLDDYQQAYARLDAALALIEDLGARLMLLEERLSVAEMHWATAANAVIMLTNEVADLKRRLDAALAATPEERERAN